MRNKCLKKKKKKKKMAGVLVSPRDHFEPVFQQAFSFLIDTGI